ncbi:MAG: transcription termination/antitermination protein NusG [Sandaracinaceae bacterium]|nr:transcription termination/antitermination protein NusG [Sandaracinaceae bacterium]
MAKKWYVVQTYSGYEQKVKVALEERVRREGLSEYFGEILIPHEQVQDPKTGEKKTKTRSFYPGYIFVEMELNEKTWYLVRSTPRVSGFVGGRHPLSIPETQVRQIAQQIAEGQIKPKPKANFENGDQVRVIEGPFANFTGVIQEINPTKQKVTVLVSIFGRSTPVELEYSQVEKMAS